MAIGTTVIRSDNFNVANGPLNSSTWPIVIGNVGIVNNQAQATVAPSSAIRNAMFDMSGCANANYGVRFTGDAGAGANRGALLRSTEDGNDCYRITIESETEYSFRRVWGGGNVYIVNPTSDNVVAGDLTAELTAEVETIAGNVWLRLRTANGGGKLIAEFEITDGTHKLLDMGRGGITFHNNNVITNGYTAINQAALIGTGVSGATKLGFSTQPVSTEVGIEAAAIVVQALTAGDVLDTAFTGPVTLARQNGSGTLGGTLTVNAVAGVATFGDITCNTVQTGLVLRATSSGLTLADSNTFNITAAVATKLLFHVQPSNSQRDAAITPAVVVRGVNAANILDTSYNGSVTMARQNGTGTLGGTLTVNASGGAATFSNLTVNTVQTSLVLRATASGVTQASSDPFDIVTPTEVPGLRLDGVNAVRDTDGSTLVNATDVVAIIRTSRGEDPKLIEITGLAIVNGTITIPSNDIGAVGAGNRRLELYWAEGSEEKSVHGDLPIINTSA